MCSVPNICMSYRYSWKMFNYKNKEDIAYTNRIKKKFKNFRDVNENY